MPELQSNLCAKDDRSYKSNIDDASYVHIGKPPGFFMLEPILLCTVLHGRHNVYGSVFSVYEHWRVNHVHRAGKRSTPGLLFISDRMPRTPSRALKEAIAVRHGNQPRAKEAKGGNNDR